MIKYYYVGGQRVAMRKGSSTLYFLLGDHLGSTAITVNGTAESGELRYYPWGETRYSSGTTPTDRQFTGQINDVEIGLYFYQARYYDGALGRFIQADSIVPGAASGSGGGAATLGYDSNTRLTPLTVHLGELVAQVNEENREVSQFGPFFQWDSQTRQKHNVPMGPANPQALNRYAYCLSNPLRYVDPTGHSVIGALLLTIGASAVTGSLVAGGAYVIVSLVAGQPIDRTELGVAMLVGAGAGAASPFITGIGGAIALGAVANGIQYGLTKGLTSKEFKWGEFFVSLGIGGVTGGLFPGSSGAADDFASHANNRLWAQWMGIEDIFESEMARLFDDMLLEAWRESWRSGAFQAWLEIGVEVVDEALPDTE